MSALRESRMLGAGRQSADEWTSEGGLKGFVAYLSHCRVLTDGFSPSVTRRGAFVRT